MRNFDGIEEDFARGVGFMIFAFGSGN